MPAYLVSIAEGRKTLAGELSIEARMALADDGFREVQQHEYSEAVWSGDPATARDEDGVPDPGEGHRRIFYLVDAEDEIEALERAQFIVGAVFNLRVSPARHNS